MRFDKRIAVGLSLVLIALSLSGCQGGNEPKVDNVQTDNMAEEIKQEAPTEAHLDANEAIAETIEDEEVAEDVDEATKGVFTSGDYDYILLPDGTAEIVRANIDSLSRSTVRIPGELDGKKVTSIGESAFEDYRFITGVVIPDGVVSIGPKAFATCLNLEDVTLPEGLISIGDRAFDHTSIVDLTIPNSLTQIGSCVFINCYDLSNITVAADHPIFAIIDKVLFSKPDKKLVLYPGKLKNTKYEIPNGIEIIGDGAFANGFFDLRTIKVPDTVTYIGDYAFYYSMGLADVNIPDGVTYIGDFAFEGCYELTSINIPNCLTKIGNNPFGRLQKLKQINLNSNHPVLELVDNVLYSKPDHRLVYYPVYLTSKEYEIPQGTLIIGDKAFNECENLNKVTIPEGITAIGVEAFHGSGITEIAIPNSVTSIGAEAFHACSRLKQVVLSNNISIIENDTFNGCKALIDISIPASVTEIGSNAFASTGIRSVVLPANVDKIGEKAFYECYSLSEITLPENIKIIDKGTFYKTGLTNVIIPDGVKEIASEAFYNCSRLERITIPNSVTWFSFSSFYGCKKLTAVVERDSYVEKLCNLNKITYIYPDSLDWLNN